MLQDIMANGQNYGWGAKMLAYLTLFAVMQVGYRSYKFISHILRTKSDDEKEYELIKRDVHDTLHILSDEDRNSMLSLLAQMQEALQNNKKIEASNILTKMAKIWDKYDSNSDVL